MAEEKELHGKPSPAIEKPVDEGDKARLVNISSVFGLVGMPRQVAYCASKFAVRGLSEALRQELAGTSVGVTVVHPGGVATSIAHNARVSKAASAEDIARAQQRMQRALRMRPDKAGEIIVSAVERRRHRVLVGSDAALISLVQRLAPVSHVAILGRLMGSRR